MPQPNLRAPVAVLVIGLFCIALLLGRAPAGEVAFSQSYGSPATSTPVPTNTSVPTSTPRQVPTSNIQAQPVVTSTPVPTPLPQPTPIPRPTALPTPTVEPSVDPTDATLGSLTCVPGVPIIIQGTARPRAPLLIFFNGRAVGGGSAGATGSFALTMRVGNERPGSYPIEVFVRGSWEEILQTSCTVPSVTQSAPGSG
jgi:hypothetical protein